MEKIPDFGDYVRIEMHRYGCDNERYVHKVVGNLRSNTHVSVPIRHGSGGSGYDEVIHGEIVDVLRVIQCGVVEDKVFKVAASDASITTNSNFT